MCVQHNTELSTNNMFKKWQQFIYYAFAIGFAVFTALSNIIWLQNLGSFIADVFSNMFKCISLPIVASSIIVTFAQYNADAAMSRVWKRSLLYTLATTIVAAGLACVLYIIIKPSSIYNIANLDNAVTEIAKSNNYFGYLASLIPSNLIAPFLEHQVISVLLLSILLGLASRKIKNTQARDTITSFFRAVHEILLVITSWIVKIVPIGLYGFITIAVMQIKNGVEIQGLGAYLAIIVMANLIQGFVILPVWLYFNGIKPFATMQGMLPALSIAFFTKSSAGTLPVTIETAERNIGIDPKISRFVLPLCTTINMNGCAAFIFVTVIYLMQIHGIVISVTMMLTWILISTIAAIGNAGVPMGCFFLSASLLASMNVPITVLGLILPLYSLIDMLETALNVWSDACVAKVVDHKEKSVVLSSDVLATA